MFCCHFTDLDNIIIRKLVNLLSKIMFAVCPKVLFYGMGVCDDHLV